MHSTFAPNIINFKKIKVWMKIFSMIPKMMKKR